MSQNSLVANLQWYQCPFGQYGHNLGTADYARRARPETAIEAQGVRFVLDRVLIFFPVHAVGRVRQHVVEFLMLVGVLRERVAEGDLLGIVAGHEHVRFADAEGFAVQLLPEQFDAN